MIYKFQYENETGRQTILDSNIDKTLIEEQNIAEGNFLIFTDTPDTNTQLNQIKQDNLILMDALATVFEEVLLLGEQVALLQGGTPE